MRRSESAPPEPVVAEQPPSAVPASSAGSSVVGSGFWVGGGFGFVGSGVVVGGVVVVEYVFGFPGIGQGLINAVSTRDIPTIQLTVLLLAAFYVSVNLVADVITVLITPKLRAATWR